jgi:hypothetical protein
MHALFFAPTHATYPANLILFDLLVGKPEGKRSLGRPRRGWVNNIKMDLTEIEWDGMYSIYPDQYRDQLRALVNTVMNLRVP